MSDDIPLLVSESEIDSGTDSDTSYSTMPELEPMTQFQIPTQTVARRRLNSSSRNNLNYFTTLVNTFINMGTDHPRRGANVVSILNKLWASRKTNQKKILNNSISAYVQTNDTAMWIPDIYEKVREFLGQDDRTALWAAHTRATPIVKPNPYALVTRPNPEYIIWLLKLPQKTIFSQLSNYEHMLYAQQKYDEHIIQYKQKQLTSRRVVNIPHRPVSMFSNQTTY